MTFDAREILKVLPEPSALLTASGRILATNRQFSEAFLRLTNSSASASLFTLAANEPSQLAEYLRLCSGSAQFLMGRIAVRGKAAESFLAYCAAIRPRTENSEAILLLRLQRKSKGIAQFELLNRQIHALQVEIVRRRHVEEEILRTNSTLEERVAARTRELESINRELRAFAHTIAHDLRAPLRGLKSFADILCDDFAPKLEAEARECALRIGQAAEAMDQLLLDLLRYAELSLIEFEIKPASWDDVVSQALRLFTPEISEKGAIVGIQPNLGWVRGHPVLMQHAVNNLLANALKFSKPGEKPSIQIFSELNDDTLVLSVEDRGIGIAPEYHARVFKIFERLDPHSSAGSGVGLAIVERSVARLGGTVSLESRPGKGTRFSIALPVAAPPDPPAA